MSDRTVRRTILSMDTTDISDISDKLAPPIDSWAALAVAILGDLLPIASWFYLADRYGDELAWQEGIGFFVFVGLLLLLLLAEWIAFSFASRQPKNPIVRFARYIAGGSLLLFGSLFAFLLLNLLLHLPIYVLRVPIIFFIVLIVIGTMIVVKVVRDKTIDPGC